MNNVTTEIDMYPVLFGYASGNCGGLFREKPMTNNRPRSNLVGTAKQYRTHPRMVSLEPSDNVVAGGDIEEPSTVDIERENPFNFRTDMFGAFMIWIGDDPHMYPAPTLTHTGTYGIPPAFERECKIEDVPRSVAHEASDERCCSSYGGTCRERKVPGSPQHDVFTLDHDLLRRMVPTRRGSTAF